MGLTELRVTIFHYFELKLLALPRGTQDSNITKCIILTSVKKQTYLVNNDTEDLMSSRVRIIFTVYNSNQKLMIEGERIFRKGYNE